MMMKWVLYNKKIKLNIRYYDQIINIFLLIILYNKFFQIWNKNPSPLSVNCHFFLIIIILINPFLHNHTPKPKIIDLNSLN